MYHKYPRNVQQMNDAISCQMVTECTTGIGPSQWEKH
jgi:hypothetical protein